MLLFISCSLLEHPNSPSTQFQSISPVVLWKTANGLESPEEVDSIRFSVFSAEGKFKDTIREIFPFENHNGALSVPAGSKLVIRVEGLDSFGRVIYKGTVQVNDASDSDIKIILESSQLSPIKPSDLTFTAFSSCNYKLHWTDNSNNESGFIIQFKGSNGTFTTLDTVSENITSCLHSEITHSEYHVYRIYAFNNAGNSDMVTDSIKSPQKNTANLAPLFIQDSAQISEIVYLGQTKKITLEVIDPNCDAFELSACPLLKITSNTVSWTPKNSNLGKNQLWVAATDDSKASDTLFWTWVVCDTIRPVMTLNGEDTIRLALNDRYIDPGANASDNVDGDISDKVSIFGTVVTTVAGGYTLTYSVKDKSGNAAIELTRSVSVLPGAFPDKVAPVIYLIGGDTIRHTIGTKFTDPGAYALDNRDDSSSISSKIEKSGLVDTTLKGTYQLIYKVEDNAKNKAQQFRYVKVVDNTAPGLSKKFYYRSE